MEIDRTSVITIVAKVLAYIVAALLSVFFFFMTFQAGWIGASAVLGMMATIFTAGWIFHLVLLMRGRPAPLSETARVTAMVATGVLWVCAGGILLFSVAYLTEQQIVAIWFAPAFVAFLVFMAAQLIHTVRRRRASLVLGYVDQAVRLDLPLSPMMLAAAQSETGNTRRRLLQLHEELDRGGGLEDALHRAVPEIRPADLRAIGAALRLGRLPHMLRRLARPDQRTLGPASDITPFYRVYLVIFLLMALATGGVMIPIAVLPKFEKLLHDFRQPPPWTTGWMIHLVHQSYGFVGVPVFILIGLLALAPLGPYLAHLFFPTRQDPPFGGLVRDQLIWWTPVLHGDVRDRGLADLCDFIADSADAGRPLDQALRNAQQTQANAVMRWRVAQWADAIERGQSLHDAARAAHMPPLVVGMLAAVRSLDDLGDVFAFLARYYEFRFSRRRELLRALHVPFVVAIMGVIVLLIALSIFQPMILLIQATMHFGGGF
jgi:MSHA biogenesis protein MshG